MEKLTEREATVYQAMLDDPDHVWTTPDIAGLIWPEEERPKSWRLRVNGLVRSLRTKTCMMGGLHVVKVGGGRGRGNIGKYALAKSSAAKSKRR